MSDLFVKLIRFADEKEDFFTECLAETFRHDHALCREFLSILLGASPRTKLAGHGITVTTQASYPRCRLDMILAVGDTKIGLEHKLWSPEGTGQLTKYLQLPVDCVAFITGYELASLHDVSDHSRYLRPRTGRSHFMWHDFSPLLEQRAHATGAGILTRALLNLFRHLGFESPPDTIPDLWAADEEGRDNRRQFAKLWGTTRSGLRLRGWSRITPASQASLDVHKGTSLVLKSVALTPTVAHGSLRIRLNVRPEVEPTALKAHLEGAPLPFSKGTIVDLRLAPRVAGKVTVVDVMISLRSLLTGAADAAAIDHRLAEYVLAVVDAAERAPG